MPSPRKIFFESTALFQLGARLDNADLSRILSVRESAGFDLLIPEVTWMEYLRHRKAEVKRCLERIRPITGELDSHQVALDEVKVAEQALQGYLSRLDEHFAERAREIGFEIVPLPVDLNVRLLLEMSINCVPPFEEAEAKTKEKGFRDSLIMFTILENIRKCPDHNAVLITGDALLAEGISLHTEQFETGIHVLADLAQTAEFLETELDEQKRALIRSSSEEAKKVLVSFRDQLANRVGEIRELNDDVLGQAGPFLEPSKDLSDSAFGLKLFKSPNEYVDIQRIDAVTFDSVITAVWKYKEEKSGSILFLIRCIARVHAHAPYLATYTHEKKYVVGERYPHIGLSISLGGSTQTEQKEMDFYLYGEAQLQRTGAQEWELTSLRLDKSLTSEEEYAALTEADLASLT